MSEDEGEESGTIVVVDPDSNSRNDAEDLEDDFERQVIAMDSVDFDTEASEDVLDAAAYVICWDLGIRSGADLLEEIRFHPRLSDKKIVVATSEPTREVVLWAMSLGADAVCTRPYDADELRGILARLEGAA